jgi:hypothetical protein
LQPDGMADPFSLCCSEHSGGLVGVAAERPFAIDVLARLDRLPIEGAAGVGYVLRRGYELPPLMVPDPLRDYLTTAPVYASKSGAPVPAQPDLPSTIRRAIRATRLGNSRQDINELWCGLGRL